MFFSKLDQKIIKNNNPQWLIGCDEVGRGCLAGPVVAASVGICPHLFKPDFLKDLLITDSKKMTAKKRQEVVKELGVSWDFHKKTQIIFKGEGLLIALSQLPAELIDEVNIFYASLMAMEKALKKVLKNPGTSYVLIDGKWDLSKTSSLNIRQEAIIKGDSHSKVIALASVMAKEFRDSLMSDYYGQKYPQYGFKDHKGYPTKIHKEAIKNYGILDIHRKTFKGVKGLKVGIKKD